MPEELDGLVMDLNNWREVEEEIDLGGYEEAELPLEKLVNLRAQFFSGFQDAIIKLEREVEEKDKIFGIIEHCFEKVLKYRPTDEDRCGGEINRRPSDY